jgi:ubiquinone/menaquinone biosynthesis C-methylase UbiE
MQLPMEANSFDGVYAIEATCHAPNKHGIYSEIFRVLKPGQRFAAYEWCMTDLYDPSNAAHRAVKLGIEVGSSHPSAAFHFPLFCDLSSSPVSRLRRAMASPIWRPRRT